MPSGGRWPSVLAAVALWTLSASAVDARLIVETVPAGGAFDRAGIRPGDVLDGWRLESADASRRGRLGSWVDWRYLVDEILPLDRSIRLVGRRADGATLDIAVGPAPWRARVRPELDAATEAAVRAGQEALDAGRREEALERWSERFDALDHAGDRAVAGWLASRLARAADPRHDDARVRPVLERALERATGRRERTVLLEESIFWTLRRGDFSAVEVNLREALERHREAGDPIGEARCLYRLGLALVRSGDPARAEPYYERALDLYRRHAPDGLAEAATRTGLGHASVLLGDLRAAEEHWSRALALYEAAAPEGGARIGVLYNLGSVTAMIGDLARAERHLHLALELEGERGEPVHRASTLNNLGELAMRRGDLDRAVEYLDEALRIKRDRTPDDVQLASSLANLGHVALTRGETERAADYYAEALAHVRRVQPGTLHEAVALENSARAELAADRTADADERLRAARAILERTAPDGPQAIDTLRTQAEVALRTGDLSRAADHYRQAAARIERAAPGTQALAEVLGELAEVRLLQARPDDAVVLLDRATAALEDQVRRVGGPPERRERFRAGYSLLYRRHVEVLVDLGRAEEAFAVLERSRARGLLDLLDGRELRLPDVPPDLDRRRYQLAARYGRELHRLATLPASAERDTALAELAALRQERDDLVEELWRAAPRVAELRHPRPLDPAAARDALASGTLLVAWSVGPERTVVFAVRRGAPIRAITLPLGEPELDHRVDRFVRWIREPRSARGADAGLLRVARQLGDDLLGPIADEIRAADSLLLSPDGPLHRLPFAALRPPLDGVERWLIESHPLSTTPSATVLAELTRHAGDPGRAPAPRLAAFGSPRLPPAEDLAADPRRSLLGEPTSWRALPAAGEEVSAIARLFPDAVAYLGEHATEARVKAVAPSVDVLHFATHALVDEEAPLESALVLSLPDELASGDENGLLQAWEIFEELRLDAELVVLSACGTALGAPVRGEGLVGLERAFHFAGARSVLASLWPVSDAATARLMERFYRHLRDGLPRDEALRRAQVAALSETPSSAAGRDPAEPVHWAAFRLSGVAGPIVSTPAAAEP